MRAVRRTHMMCALAALVFLCGAGRLHAQALSTVGGQAGSPFRLGFGPRGIAMGNALVAVTDGSLTAYYNPAVLSFQDVAWAGASVSLLSLDRHLNTLTFVQPLRPQAGFSLSVVNAGVSGIEERNRDGIQTGTLSTSENAFLFSFALRPDPAFSMGLTAKLLYYPLYAGVTSTTVGLDVGVLVRLSPAWTLGGTLQDLNSRYRWETSSLYGQNGASTIDRFPVRRQIGIAWHADDPRLTVAAGFESLTGLSLLKGGVEYTPLAAFAVRAGIDQISADHSLSARPSFGASFMTDISDIPVGVHYAFQYDPYGPGNMHVISVSAAIK